MAILITRLGKGFWNVSHNGLIFKRKVSRTVKGNFVTIAGKKVSVK